MAESHFTEQFRSMKAFNLRIANFISRNDLRCKFKEGVKFSLAECVTRAVQPATPPMKLSSTAYGKT